MRNFRAGSIGSINAWLPSRRSTLHQVGGAVIARPGQVRSGMSMGPKGRYLSEGVRNMVRFSGVGRERLIAGKPVIHREALQMASLMGFGVSPVLLAPTVGAWGLLRLGAQKEKREHKRRPGAELRGGREVRAKGHV